MALGKRVEAAGVLQIAGRVARVTPGELEVVTRAGRRRVALDAHVVVERGTLRAGAHVAIDALPAQRLRQESLYREPSQESVLEATRVVVGHPRRLVAVGALLLGAAAIGAMAWPRAPGAQELTAPHCPPETARVTTRTQDGGWIHFCLTHDRTREGPYSRWSAGGMKVEERSYGRGRLHGEARTWHATGKLARQTTYVDGVRHGPSRTWQPSGLPAATGQYRNGEQHGRWMWRTGGRLVEAMFADGWPVPTRRTD
jgi:hypothetical protein